MSMKIRKVKRSTLVLGIIVALVFSIFMGYTAGTRGFGSLYPQLNLVAGPFLCPGNSMSYDQHVSEIGSDTYWSATWFCTDKDSGAKTELDSNTVFLYASPLYGVLFFAILATMTYAYWNSSIGPAKNDGLELW